MIDSIADAKFIYIFGPGEAKDEFKKCLEKSGLDKDIVNIETADKMTADEIKKTENIFMPGRLLRTDQYTVLFSNILMR